MTTRMLPLCLFAALLAALQEGGKTKPGDAGRKSGDAEPFADIELADDVKEIPCEDVRAGGDEQKRYFLLPAKEKKPPAAGYALLVVMPGGSGEASFNNFVRRIWREATPRDWVVAQMVCVMWKPDQKTIWPTRMSRVPAMKFTTEEYFAAVVEDVRKVRKLKIDPARIYQMGWSSGGTAEYAIALQEEGRLVTASYVAQSVFYEGELGPLVKHAKGQAFFLDHSPDDVTCKFECATKAQELLTKAGAAVELVTYPGGHGWLDNPYARMAKGFAWIDKHHGKPPR